MSFTIGWSSTFESQPADTEDARLGAGRIRDLKNAIRERAENFAQTGTAGDGSWELAPRAVASAGGRPSSPATGDVIIRTDLGEGVYQRWDGSNWRTLGRIVNEVTMWAGLAGSIPAGWALCDGSTVNSIVTPDLRGRFIVGHDIGDTDYDTIDFIGAPDTGGAKTHTLTIAEIPAHDHTGTTDPAGEALNLAVNADGGITRNTSPAVTTHTHTFTTDMTGGGGPHETRPPYYTLAFIMYVGGE